MSRTSPFWTRCSSPLTTGRASRRRRLSPRVAFGALLLALASAAAADVLTLANGDRVSGHVLSVSPRRVRIQTRYGPLVVPHDEVVRIEYDDGRVEVVAAPPPPPAALPPPPPAPEPARLQLAVSGDSFWQAWDPKEAPADPSLRLDLHLDDAPLASYTDSALDPEDLPKAIVNSFVFSPKALGVRAGPGVVVAPPLVAGKQIGLALTIPAEAAGEHELRLAYQRNEGSAGEPTWRNLVTAAVRIAVVPGETVRLRLEQSRGAMEYAHHRMQKVETFNVVLSPAGEALAAPGRAAPTPPAQPGSARTAPAAPAPAAPAPPAP